MNTGLYFELRVFRQAALMDEAQSDQLFFDRSVNKGDLADNIIKESDDWRVECFQCFSSSFMEELHGRWFGAGEVPDIDILVDVELLWPAES